MKKPNRNRDKSQKHSQIMRDAMKEATAEPSKRLNIQVPQSLHARIKIYAAEQGITMQDLVIGAVDEAMKK